MKRLAILLSIGMMSAGNHALAGQSDTSFAVVNFGSSAYRIDGVNNPTLTLTRGQTCTFNVNSPGHPFYIKTTRVTGTGSQFMNGVTGQGVTSGQLTFVVPLDAPSMIFYQCGVHGSMGGTLNIADPLAVDGASDPNEIWLGPATPNPAREGSRFQFGLPNRARVDFAVFDGRGRRVRGLMTGVQSPGEHFIRWDGRDRAGKLVPSGLYFYRLRVAGRLFSGRLVMMR